MYTLFMDTSTKFLCLGISRDNQILYKYQEEAIKKQSELTIPFLQEALKKCQITLNDINQVVVTVGPGSFTGIRIGMCIAKVLASLNHIPLVAISSLNAYANLGNKIVLLDAKANRAYIGIYHDNEKEIEESVLPLDEVNALVKAHPNYDVVLDAFLVNQESEIIDVIENMNRIYPSCAPVSNVDALVPIYLKDR